MPLLDLAEVDDVMGLHPAWSASRAAPVWFRREDFLGDPAMPLDGAVRDLVGERTGRRPEGPVAMLANLRTWGWLFNPISLYFCADVAEPAGDQGPIDSLVAEVENTPWHERHAYVVGPPGSHRFAKELHVSPFLPMDVDYELRYTAPGERLTIGLDVLRGDQRLFAATLSLRRRALDRAGTRTSPVELPGHDAPGLRRHLRPGGPPAAEGRSVLHPPGAPTPEGRACAAGSCPHMSDGTRSGGDPDRRCRQPARDRRLVSTDSLPPMGPRRTVGQEPVSHRRRRQVLNTSDAGSGSRGGARPAHSRHAIRTAGGGPVTCRAGSCSQPDSVLGGAAIDVTEGGETFQLGRGEPMARVTVHDRRAYGALLRSGSVGLGTSYVAGWWDTDDLTALGTGPVARHPPATRAPGSAGAGLGCGTRHPGPPGHSGPGRRQAQHHRALRPLQRLLRPDAGRDHDLLVRRVRAARGVTRRSAGDQDRPALCQARAGATDHLLEIGSGWGGLAVHAATRYGCRVTTTTISDAQRTYVEKRVADAGLADRITVLGLDWRDLTGQFDKLVSVEMVEAVDWRLHDQFLAKCADLLTDDGLAAIQAIVIDDRSFERAKRHQDFVRRMVFPGGCLPSVASLTTSVARATDLRIVDLEDIGRHYAETLRRWADNLAAHTGEVAALGVRRELRRLWDLYLAYCEASFLERHISDVQLVLAKPGRAGRLAARPG